MQYYTYEDFRKAVNEKAEKRHDEVKQYNKFIMLQDNQAQVDGEIYKLNQTFHNHLSQKFDIPKKYYERMQKEKPLLLENTINTWNDKNKNFLFRSYKENYMFGQKKYLRGMLSDRYKIMDNYEILNYLEPLFEKNKIVLLSGYLDDSFMSLKIRFPNLISHVRQGDTVYGGIYLRNSEVGNSSLTISSLIYRLVCTNGLMLPKTESITSSLHLGKVNKLGTLPNYIIPDLVCNKLDETIKVLLNKNIFQDNINILRMSTKATYKKIDMEKAKDFLNISSDEKNIIHNEILKEQDYTIYGLIQSLTSSARKLKNISRSLYLERIAGNILYNQNNAKSFLKGLQIPA